MMLPIAVVSSPTNMPSAATTVVTSSAPTVRVDPGAALGSASVAGTGSQLLYGITGGARVVDSAVDTTTSGYGIFGPHPIQRVTVRGALVGILNRGGTAAYKLDQAVVAVPAGALGIVASATATTSTTVTADHLTIVGDGNNTSIGASTQAIEAGPPQNAKLVLRSSIVRRVGHALELRATNGAANILRQRMARRVGAYRSPGVAVPLTEHTVLFELATDRLAPFPNGSVS
jgi:hypothetical protein